MNKVILVKAYFCEALEQSDTIPTKKSDPWGDPNKKQSETKSAKVHVEKQINAEKLAADLEEALTTLYTDGYDLKEIVNVTSGAYGYKFKEDEITSVALPFVENDVIGGGASYGYGYGYSFTDSLIVVGAKRV